MAEVLSQSQIDDLLRSVASGDEPVVEEDVAALQKARKYDFLAPKMFTKDSLRIIDSIYSNYTRVLQTTLSSVLRMNGEVEILDIEEQKYSEFNNALNDNEVMAVLKFKVDEDEFYEQPILVQISNAILEIMIDRMLGGIGLPNEGEEFKGYTDIELSVLENIYTYIAPLMNDVWQNYFAVNIDFERMEENPRLMQNISIEDTVVIVVLNITLRDISGTMNVCLPGDSLEALFKTFEDKRRVPSGRLRDPRKHEDAKETILSNISGSTLELTVKLGDAEVRLGDVYRMRVGDIINLNKPKNSDALLYVENVPWFTGELGVQRQNKALKIKGRVKEI